MSTDPTLAPDAPTWSERSPAAHGRLNELARRYYIPLLSFFRKRTRDAAEVQDLVQEVFLRLAQCHEIGNVQNPEGYIFQTASNTLKDHYRRSAVREDFAKAQLANDALR
ncbi:MAG: RNA polymerase sigma factor, partial [Steroidobacteraceae bacterium]